MKTEFELEKNKLYWLKDKESVYIPGTYRESAVSGACNFQDYRTGASIICKLSDIYQPVVPPYSSLTEVSEDLVNSIDISEPYILWSLRARFLDKYIYSSIGTIIIALNPYRNLPELYTQELLYKYAHLADTAVLPPHIWTIARASYINLKSTGLRQAIVISGESGAGTELN